MSSFQGTVVAVTGAAMGIGLATAKLLAQRGAHLSLADVQGELLAKAVVVCRAAAADAGFDIKIMTAVVDVSQRDAVDAWIRRTVDELGGLDAAANIAGIYRKNTRGCLADEDDGDWDRTMAVNLTGVMYCVRAQMASMLALGAVDGTAAKRTHPKASIVNVSSILGLQGSLGMAAYCASKHGVIGLTRTASKEAISLGIRVNCVAPYVTPLFSHFILHLTDSGFIKTSMIDSLVEVCGGEDKLNMANTPSTVPMSRMGQAEEVAELIVFLLGRESSYITGQCISVDGGWNA